MNRRAWLLAVSLLLAATLRGDSLDPFIKSHNRFADAINKWAKGIMRISPSSTNYRQLAAELYYECRVGELFREFERDVTDWR